MATEIDMKLNTAETGSSCIADIVKVAFCTWLSSNQRKPVDTSSVISVLDVASEQLQKRKITHLPIWEITKPSTFANVYSKARDNKFFKIMDKKNYLAFMRDGQLYLKFLKSKPVFQANNMIAEVQSPDKQLSANTTIKEAVLKVLSDESRPMTADEIYDKIIKRGLYTFGAQNPVNVVRTTIEYACDNSGYSTKDAVPLFHYEKNSDGKRVYSLLATAQREQDASAEEILTPHWHSMTIWNYKVEREFQEWLENEKYTQKTADIYSRATAQIFRNYAVLAQNAIETSNVELEAVRKYIELLNKDSNFVEANVARHNQFTAALSALERFYSTRIEIVDGKQEKQIKNRSETISVFSSPLNNIVDFEEGKAGIREILEAHFQTLYGYSNISILWNAAQDTLSLFLNDNAINTADELWRFVYRSFFTEYVMSYPHIWKTQPNYPQSYVGVIINLARQLGGTVNREQIDDYFARIKQGSPINATIIRQGLLMFYASKHFILTEMVDLTNERCATITKSLHRLFECEKVSYIVLRDITSEWFSTLPTIKGGLCWTALLLQEALRLRPNIGYRVVFSGLDGQALDTLGAAIVPKESDITCFADVVHRYCHDREILGKKMATEELRTLLRDAGMLEGNELIYNIHKALRDYRFAFTDENRMVKILER
ncbi:MAG: hypothetical protein BWY11_00205 [Firmicutes bacterium ADurb.Bin182]|nr:MAG: hypothetical protein BWY11_00205 [Firmicutes bacterium ADurb.Bin182]